MRNCIFKLSLIFLFIGINNAVFAQSKLNLRVVNSFSENHYPMRLLAIDAPQKNADGAYHFVIDAPIPFSAFGIGWSKPVMQHHRGDFIVEYASKWNDFKEDDAFVSPDETPTGLYWTNVLFGIDEYQHTKLEFYLKMPQDISVNEIYISLMDMSQDADPFWKPELTTVEGSKACPEFPTYIARSGWCGSYTACHNPTYSVTTIVPTHTVIHHGASPDTYTDGAAVARSYWNYHVNTLGWNDIGYNYLTDKFGNLYQGRHNLNLPTTDVLGAHAGASNSKSIGVNFMGNADVTQPTTAQLTKCQQFLAWWYDYRGFDPTSSASITLQSGGTGTVYRICGHKDVNVGGTSCPGTVLYGQLASIRTATKAIIDGCGGTLAPTNLTAAALGCPDNNVTFSWSNSGTGWYIHVANNSGFTNPYIKWVSGLTTYTGPAGFVLVSDGTTPLTLSNSTTYYWRMWNGSAFTSGTSFTTLNCDNVAPTTSISTPGTWKTENFTATFTDSDNSGGSGLEKSFYQVLDNSGTDWRANNNNGFFSDNFDLAMHADWTVSTGNWATSGGYLTQSDTSNGNTNIYASLNQSLSNRYLYHFTAKMGSGIYGTSQRRFGFHFFSDNGSLTNRGNGYFIFFRQETSKLEFYKVTSDVFTQVKIVDNVTTNFNQLYDIKVIYDRISGKMDVYRDNALIGTWTDTAPYSTGNYISFRSGNSHLYIGELKVYRSRAASVTVSVGSASTNDIRYQNSNPTTYGAKIKSICNDAAGNLSAVSYHDLNVDWTVPSNITAVFDGLSNDIDTIYVTNEMSANWAASSDTHSGVSKYWYCIGSTPGGTEVLGWTDNNSALNFVKSGLSLNYNQTYYISVKAQNSAGLYSTPTIADGVFVKQSSAAPVAGFTYSNPYICEGTTVNFINNSTSATDFQWTISGPASFNSTEANPTIAFTLSGAYTVNLSVTGTGGTDALTQTVDVVVYPAPTANAGNDLVVCTGESVTLNASGGTQYQWSGGLTNNVPFTPDNTATYSVTVTNSDNCTDTDEVIVTVNPTPVAVAGNDVTVCSGNEIILSASGGDTYIWNNNVVNDVAFVPVISGIYSVTVSNSFNCTDEASVTVTVLPQANASFHAIDTLLIYPNTSAVFINTSQNADSYTWDFGDGYSSNDDNPWHSYDTTGTYTIILYALNENCGMNSSVLYNYINIIHPTNISTFSVDAQFIVSPNPFTDVIRIHGKDLSTGALSLKMYDVTGKEIRGLTIMRNDEELIVSDISNKIAAGLYSLVLIQENKVYVFNLIKE